MGLISKNFPLIGFAQKKPLEKDFFVQAEQEPNSIVLNLIPKEDNSLAQNYTKIICDIDINSYLPEKITAFTKEEDYYEISLDNANVNISIDKSIFDVNAPSDFTVQTTYLDKD
jgi:outer membrane lipoprotein-sorting protein